MKKIIITESQAKRLNLITEDMNPLIQFEAYCKELLKEVNKQYVKVISLSIGEILNNEIDMADVNDYLNKIEDKLRVANKKTYSYIEALPENDLDLRVDNANDSVMIRLTSLQLITMDLEKIQSSSNEHNIKDSFGDVEPMDISGIQS